MQFCNHLEVVILPPYRPSAAERADARLYADNVRAAMAAALGAPLSAQGIAQQQALKRAGVTVDWTGRCGTHMQQRRMCTSASSPRALGCCCRPCLGHGEPDFVLRAQARHHMPD